MKATTIRRGDRFETGLLWRYDDVNLPNRYSMARRRLACFERKGSADANLNTRLTTLMADYVKKGYVRKLTETEAKTKSNKTWYLPILAVNNPNKPGKTRIVWDAAAKVDGISLNSVLLKGPDQLAPLPHVLYGFRQRAVAVCGDIREMFHQVRIRREDAQRFLWKNENGEIESYVMEVMTFGATCSPSSAHYIKNMNAAQFADDFPRAVDAIVNHH